MMVNSVQVSDGEVRDAVLRKLRLDARLRGTEIEVTVAEGAVTLSGVVGGHAELLAAWEAARSAEGAYAVVNELKVDALAGRPRTDANIGEAVRRALEWDALLPHREIEVAVSNGWVALHGRVERVRDRENAERLARRLEGVRGVYNMIEVEGDGMRVENVRDRIAEALRQRARLEAESLDISLAGGTVRLAGKVHTWAEKQAVLGALRDAPGIERVQDQLSIDPYC